MREALTDELIINLLRHSYSEVVKKFTGKIRAGSTINVNGRAVNC